MYLPALAVISTTGGQTDPGEYLIKEQIALE